MSLLPDFSLDGKIAVVTGGYGHLGKSICKALSEANATVICCGRNIDKYQESFGKQGKSNISFVELDVSSSFSIKRAFESIQKEYKKINILINNAFYSEGTSPEKMTDKEWNNGIEGTLNSVFKGIREIIPFMKKAKEGNIINIASMYGIVSPDFRVYDSNPEFLNPPNYGTAKAGVIQLTRYYAVYLAKYNIRVNCISPGAFPSLKVQKNESFIDKLSKKIPMGRIGEPNELKGAIIFLASEASSYITGQNIVIDGGWTIC